MAAQGKQDLHTPLAFTAQKAGDNLSPSNSDLCAPPAVWQGRGCGAPLS